MVHSTLFKLTISLTLQYNFILKQFIHKFTLQIKFCYSIPTEYNHLHVFLIELSSYSSI